MSNIPRSVLAASLMIATLGQAGCGVADPVPHSQAGGAPQDCGSIESRVHKIIAEQLGIKAADVTGDASFVDDLGADSLDTVELVMALEEAFALEIPDEDAEKITTVKQAIDYIASHANCKR